MASKMKRKVFIVGGGNEYKKMFAKEGWEIVDQLKDADLVQFTGGEDVTPALYNERPHKLTANNPVRDAKEAALFQWCIKNNKPMAGICRGGQFLNVMCGGEMWQHVEGHAMLGTHEAVDSLTGERFQVTSTHHQMMRPSSEGMILIHANCSTFKERMETNCTNTVFGHREPDVEAVYYAEQKCFCFQPHPEFAGYDTLAARYFDYIEEWLFYEGEPE